MTGITNNGKNSRLYSMMIGSSEDTANNKKQKSNPLSFSDPRDYTFTDPLNSIIDRLHVLVALPKELCHVIATYSIDINSYYNIKVRTVLQKNCSAYILSHPSLQTCNDLFVKFCTNLQQRDKKVKELSYLNLSGIQCGTLEIAEPGEIYDDAEAIIRYTTPRNQNAFTQLFVPRSLPSSLSISSPLFPALCKLNLSSCALDDQLVSIIGTHLTQLTALNLSNNPLITSKAIAYLAPLQQLQCLALQQIFKNGMDFASNYCISPLLDLAGARPFLQLKGLQILDLSNNGFGAYKEPFSDDFLTIITSLKQLVIHRGNTIKPKNFITIEQVDALRERAPHVAIISDVSPASTKIENPNPVN